MIDITFILVILIVVIFAVSSYYLVPFLKQKNFDRWLRYAVQAMEETEKGSGKGSVKFEKVKEFLQEKGFTYDDKTLEIAIDGMVWELINQYDDSKK